MVAAPTDRPADDTWPDRVGRLERRLTRERSARQQAEQLLETRSGELWQERERYRLLVENSSDVVFQVAPDDTYTWVSPSARDVLGWEPDDLVGRPLSDVVDAEDVERIMAARRNPVAGAATVEEYRYRRGDGTWVWVSSRSRPISDGAGRHLGRVVALRDVDELVRTRRTLESDRARLEATLRSLIDPHVLLEAIRDDNGRIVDFRYADVNEAACRYMDLPREQLRGSRLLDLLPGQAGTGMLGMYADAVESGIPLVLDDYAYPHELLESERRYDIRAIRVGDALSFTWRDVTERHAEAAALAASEQQFRLLAENAGDIVIRTREGITEWVSPSVHEVLGWDPGELVGTDLRMLVHEDDRAVIDQAGSLLVPGGTSSLRYRVRTSSGAWRWMHASSRVWVDDRGEGSGTVGTLRDIDEEVAAQEALAASEERYRLLAENSSDVVLHIRHGRLVWVSPSVRESLGWTPAECVGRSLGDFVHPEDLARVLATGDLLDAGNTDVSRFRTRSREGRFHWVETHGRPYIDDDGEQDGVVVSFRTVDAEVAAELELARRATYDELTGLLNRHEVLERLDLIQAHPPRAGHQLAIVFCDIDYFKQVNDADGHAAGDALLREVSTRIRTAVRACDLVARVGGDEILAVLDGIRDLDDAARIAEKIRASVSGPIRLRGSTLTSTLSIGVTLALPGEPVDDAIARADDAMFRAKRSGRDRVVAVAAPG